MNRIAFAAIAALSFSACTSSMLTVEQPYTGSQRFSTATVVQAPSSVTIDPDDLGYTHRRLETALFSDQSPIFDSGQQLAIRWRYVGFDEGSRVGRWLAPGVAGGSKIVLEAEFVDQDGRILSTVRSQAEVGAGLIGGTGKSGIDKAVEEIADYAAANFR